MRPLPGKTPARAKIKTANIFVWIFFLVPKCDLFTQYFLRPHFLTITIIRVLWKGYPS